jgi:formylglycine-generating enzyme required for sulfatase activity
MPNPILISLLCWSLGTTNVHAQPFAGARAGDERAIADIRFCWCPAGRFRMGSPRHEPQRRPGENQVNVTLTSGFWIGKYEVTQGEWKRVIGEFPGQLTAGEGVQP